MILNRRFCYAARRPVSRRGEVKMEYVFSGALAVIIAVSLSLAVYFGFFGGGANRQDISEIELLYKCDKCQAEFSQPLEQLAPEEMMQKGAPRPVDCPECGATASAWRMTECPSCGKSFVSPKTRNPFTQEREICPHCNTDIPQWRRDNRKKR